MKRTSEISLIVCDDHKIVVDGLISNFKDYAPHFTILGAAHNGQELLNLLRIKQPDVILLDMRMPIMNGEEVLNVLKDKYPQVKPIIFSSHKKDYLESLTASHGARSYLYKNAGIEEIIKTVEQVVIEGYALKSKSARFGYKAKKNKKISYLIDGVEIFEDEITLLKLLCENKTSKEIADILKIKKKTVEFRKARLCAKTKRKGLTDLIQYAREKGIVFDDDE